MGPVDEDLQLQGGGGPDGGDLLPGELPGQDHPGKAQLPGGADALRGVDGHLGGGVEGHGGGQGLNGGGHAPVLDDEGVHPGVAGGADAVLQGGELPVEGDDVQGLVDPDAEAVGVGHGLPEGVGVKVPGIRPGAEALLPQVDGVCAAADGGLQRLPGAHGGQNLRGHFWSPAGLATLSRRL